jgi:hypothetical protein
MGYKEGANFILYGSRREDKNERGKQQKVIEIMREFEKKW